MLYRLYQKHVFPHILNQVMQVPSLMDRRRELLLPIHGEVLEIGFGTGLNLPFYQAVNTLYALEPNSQIFELAQPRIELCPFHVEHIQAGAEQLPFEDQSLDHIVSTWTFCSIAQLEDALAEIHRVLKPTGTLHLVEHVLYRDNERLKHLQNLLNPIQKVIADGCHLNRDMETILSQAHFKFLEKQYFDAEGIPKIGGRMLLARVKKAER